MAAAAVSDAIQKCEGDSTEEESTEEKSSEGEGESEEGNGDKPYSDPKNRPKYDDDQVEEVWENAKQKDGKVYDPKTGEELKWDKSKTRNGQWDMGHKPGEEYRKLHKDYMDGKITKEEFLEKYRDPNNYQPESPSSNRSHKQEVK